MTRALALTGLGLAGFLLPWLAFVSDRGIAWVTGGAAILSLPWLLRHRGAVKHALSRPVVWLGLAGLGAITLLGLSSSLWTAVPEQAARVQELSVRSALALVTAVPLVLLALTLNGARTTVSRALACGIAVGLAIALFDFASDHLALRIREAIATNVATPDGIIAAARNLGSERFMTRFNDFWVVMTLSMAVFVTAFRPGWLFPVTLLAFLVLSFLSISETSQLIGIIGVLVYVFCHLAGRAGVMVMALVTIGVLVSAPLLFPSINGLLLASFDGSNLLEYKLLERFEIWAAVVDTVSSHPLLGHGLEFERLNATYNGPGNYYGVDHLWHPHSVFAQVWQDLGLLGVVATTALILALHLAAARAPNAQRACATALIAMSVGAFGAAHSIWLGWWICMFILVVTATIAGVRGRNGEKQA